MTAIQARQPAKDTPPQPRVFDVTDADYAMIRDFVDAADVVEAHIERRFGRTFLIAR